MKRRRGSLLLVITFGSLMAWVVVSMLTLATRLYGTSKDSAKVYADIQSYRAATEMACYQYVTDLESIVVTKDLDGDWISVEGNAVYSQALEAIQGALASPEDSTAWVADDIREVLAAPGVSNPEVLVNLLGRLADVRQEFKLIVPEPMKLDWQNSQSWKNRNGAYVALAPIRIEVTLSVRGETVSERFDVGNLFLDVSVSKGEVGGERHQIATLVLSEGESGVTITRAQLETTSGDDVS